MLGFCWRVRDLERWWGPRWTDAAWYARPFAWFQMFHEQPYFHMRIPWLRAWPVLDCNLLGLVRLTVWLPGFVKVQAGKLSGLAPAWRVEAYVGLKYDGTMRDWLFSLALRARSGMEPAPDPRGMA